MSKSSRRQTLRPPIECHIKGLYFRFGPCVQSLGAIYAAGSRGSTCPSILPTLASPSLDPGGEFSKSAARLSRIQKVWFYYDSDYCIGLRLFYAFGNSDVVGRIQGEYSHELILTHSNPICRIWLIHEGGRLKELGFETECNKELREGSHPITESTVCRQTCVLNIY